MSTMKTTFKTFAAATTLAAVALLSACSGTGEATATTEPTHTATSAPAPVETTPAPVSYNAGDVVDPDVELPEGQGVYELPDGTAVVVDQDEKLPKAVEKDMHRIAEETFDPKSPTASWNQLPGIIAGLEDVTGKKIVMVAQLFGSFGDEEARLLWAGVGSSGGFSKGAETATEARANAEAVIATKADSANWVIITQ